MSRRFVRSSALDRTNADVIPRCAIAHRGCATRTRVYPSSAISLSKSATADLDAQARNPYSRSWLWIPGSRQEARPGMTMVIQPFVLSNRRRRFRHKRAPAAERRDIAGAIDIGGFDNKTFHAAAVGQTQRADRQRRRDRGDELSERSRRQCP